MNFLQRKILSDLVFAAVFLISLGSCGNQKDVIEVFAAVKVESDGYIYSQESIFRVGEKKYSLRQKAVYGDDGIVQKLIVYRSEGVIEYGKDELGEDRKLLDYLGFPFYQNWVYVNKQLIDGRGEKVEDVKKLGEHLLKAEKNNKSVFYKIK